MAHHWSDGSGVVVHGHFVIAWDSQDQPIVWEVLSTPERERLTRDMIDSPAESWQIWEYGDQVVDWAADDDPETGLAYIRSELGW
jgi:hypothetical protein